MSRIKLNKFLSGVGLCLILFVGTSFPAHPCTLFAAAGGRVEGGGTLIAKNRDRRPQRSALKFYAPAHGFKYVGLVAVDSPYQEAVAGVNEKGLVVVDATPSTLPARERNCGAVGVGQTLLNRCASVAEVLAHKDLLASSHPVFQMVADQRQIAWIEVGPGGVVAVKVSDHGALYHTNHYLDPRLQGANRKANLSSRIRYDRIGELLNGPAAPLTFKEFVAFSQDRHDGPDNSIYRTGSKAGKIRTLATWMVTSSPQGAPRLLVMMANPGEAQQVYCRVLDARFWQQGHL